MLSRKLNRATLVALLLCCTTHLCAQEVPHRYAVPLDIPLLLSGGFGELRANHFHGGLDIKTQGVEGKAVYAIEEGYVSRISVTPGGYGHALYVEHPNGYTSVYGHLQSFAPQIAAYVLEQQLAQESWEVNLFPEPHLLPVKRGEQIALSGNTGGSGGPHLHLEIRTTATNEPIDPLQFYTQEIADTRPPRATSVMFYPQKGSGVVCGSTQKMAVGIASGTALARTITAWGDIALGLKAYDYMDNTTNTYGVLSVKLFVDDKEVFHSYIDRFSFAENRAINAWTDYEQFHNHKSWYMRQHRLRGNPLRQLHTDAERGILHIDQERDYHIRYLLQDRYGNTATYRFTIKGRKQAIPPHTPKGKNLLLCEQNNVINQPGMRAFIERGLLYDDVEADTRVITDSTAIAHSYQLHSFATPLHDYAPIEIAICYPLPVDSTQYYLAQVVGAARHYCGGTYRNGWVRGDIRELGTYTIAVDTIPPTVEPLNKQAWRQTSEIAFRLTDRQSGIAHYKVTIDGMFVPFSYNLQRRLACKLRNSHLPRTNSWHNLVLQVVDHCGNTTVVEEKIYY